MAFVTIAGKPVRMGLLLDYPLRLWARQQQYNDGLMREFNLLLIGEESGQLREQAPGRLLKLAETFTHTYGPLLTSISEERRRALEQGLDRMDSRLPLLDGLPGLFEDIDEVMVASDEFCRRAELLILPRPDELVKLFDWSRDELLRQYGGDDPRPWPGPF